MTPVTQTQTYASQAAMLIEQATPLPDVLAQLVAKSLDFSPARELLTLDKDGVVIDSEQNRKIEEAMIGALTDPECPREIINQIFCNCLAHSKTGGSIQDYSKAVNQIVRKAVDTGKAVNLDDTDLAYINLSGIDFAGTLSAKNAKIYRANLTDANLSRSDLSGTKFDEVSGKGLIYEDTNLTDCNLVSEIA